MTGASFTTFFFWMSLLGLFCVLVGLAAQLLVWAEDERAKAKEREARRLRRILRDQAEPQRWTS